MQGYFAALAIVLLLGMVLARVWLMKRQGIRAFHFGSTDKTDFLIPPFALFYFYTVFAAPARETLSLARAFSSESLPRT
jgi:hypothetical protein